MYLGTWGRVKTQVFQNFIQSEASEHSFLTSESDWLKILESFPMIYGASLFQFFEKLYLILNLYF